MHLVIQWPDRWLAAAGSEQAYRERVTATLLAAQCSDAFFTWQVQGEDLRENWSKLERRTCPGCGERFAVWRRVSFSGPAMRNDDLDLTPSDLSRPAPRCPLCHPVDSLRVDKLSPADRIRLLQELAKHKDVAEVLPVESDLAQVRFGGESHERPRAPADVLRIAELEACQGFDKAALVAAPQLGAYDTKRAVLLEIQSTPHDSHARFVFAVPQRAVVPDRWASMREPPF